jgi:catecholate siderophore receptor
MSKYIRGKKKPVTVAQLPKYPPILQERGPIHATIVSPISPAAVGLASMMLVSGAAAQGSSTAPKPQSSTVGQQQETTTLPQIDVRSRKRAARPRPVVAAPTLAPVPVLAPAVIGAAASTSYQTPSNSGLSRVPTTLLNTPQTVNVVTQQVIQDQNVSNLRDALRNVAGITFRAGEGGNQGDTPYIRGFSAQNDVFRDGVRDPGWYTRDTFATDAVEVYKGPASVLFGRGSTGGAINLISKLPQDRNFVEGTLSGNTGPGVRATLDANRKVDENLSTRIVVMGQEYDIPGRDHIEENRWGVAPSIKYKFNERTSNTLSYIYQHDNNIPDYGIPFLSAAWGIPRSVAPVRRDTWYGILSAPYPDVERVDASIVTNKFEHEFNDNLKVINTTRYSNVDRFQRNVFPEPNANVPSPPNLNANWTINRAQVAVTNTLAANATDFQAKVNHGMFQHTIAAGFEINRETRDFLRNQFTTNTTNFLNPDPWRAGGVPLAPTANQLTYGEATDAAIYFADQVKIGQYFEVLGSARLEQYKFTQNAPIAAASVQNLERVDNLFSWRVGGVYHPTPNSSVYLMHGTSFNPSADNLSIAVTTPATALSLVGIPPEKNETTEIGFKADVLNNQLTLQTAYFHTLKTNLRVPDPSNSSVTILDGVVTADGFEASASGKLTELWQIIASYTYVNARITKTTVAAQLNNEPMNTPTQSFSLWTTYDITPKFQIGGGAFYTGELYGDLPNTALVPAFWRFDAMAAYKVTRNATLQLNVYNITDKYYYGSAYSNWAVPGPGRMAALTLRVKY